MSSFKWQYPFYPHCGPLNEVDATRPTNVIDAACWEHDVEYGKVGSAAYFVHNYADEKFLEDLDEVGGFAANFYAFPFRLKKVIWDGVGYNITRGDNLYNSILDQTTTLEMKRGATGSKPAAKRTKTKVKKMNIEKPDRVQLFKKIPGTQNYHDALGWKNPAGKDVQSTAELLLLNDIPQGSGITERIGNKIRIKGIEVSGFILRNGATGGFYDRVRLAIVYDRRPRGVTLNYGDVYKAETSSTSSDLLNYENRNRIDIIKQWDFNLIGVAASGDLTAQSAKNISAFIPCNKYVEYNGSGTTIGSIVTGSLYAIVMGDIADPNDSHIKVRFRLYYDDING